MSPTNEVNEDSQYEKCTPVLQDINGNVFGNVKNFFEKYFEERPWSVAAQRLAKGFKSTQPKHRSAEFLEHRSRESFLEWFSTYQATLPHGCSTYHTSVSQPLAGFDECDTPTLYLMRPGVQEPKQEYGWADIQVIGQFSEENVTRYRQERLLFCMHAWRLFNNQPTRRFLHGFHVRGSAVQLWVFDRSGAYICAPFDIIEDPNRFLTAIAGYAMMNDEELGLNTVIQKNASGKYVVLQGHDRPQPERLYLEERPIRSHPGIMYNGPTCYRAKRAASQAWEFVVKFAWRGVLTTPEEDITRLVTERKVWGVVQLFAHQDITTIDAMRRDLNFNVARAISLERNPGVDGVSTTEFTTEDDDLEGEPAGLENTVDTNCSPFENLAFYSIAIHPVGRPIEDYNSVLELLYAFHDVVKGHRSLYLDGQILHQDVSKDNIMISTTYHEGSPRGFLIDLDASRRLDTGAKPEEGERKGTRPFMAIGVLLARPHTYRHDLESLFYCFLWIAISGHGQKWPPRSCRLWAWFQGDFEECAQSKSKDMRDGQFENILGEFCQEFKDLKELAQELRHLLFPIQDGSFLMGSDVESEDVHSFYQTMIDAFNRAVASCEKSI